MSDQTGSFEHPTHGKFEDPDAVLANDSLSHSQKKTLLEEWRSSLQHILRNDPDAPQVKATSEKLERAIATL